MAVGSTMASPRGRRAAAAPRARATIATLTAGAATAAVLLSQPADADPRPSLMIPTPRSAFLRGAIFGTDTPSICRMHAAEAPQAYWTAGRQAPLTWSLPAGAEIEPADAIVVDAELNCDDASTRFRRMLGPGSTGLLLDVPSDVSGTCQLEWTIRSHNNAFLPTASCADVYVYDTALEAEPGVVPSPASLKHAADALPPSPLAGDALDVQNGAHGTFTLTFGRTVLDSVVRTSAGGGTGLFRRSAETGDGETKLVPLTVGREQKQPQRKESSGAERGGDCNQQGGSTNDPQRRDSGTVRVGNPEGGRAGGTDGRRGGAAEGGQRAGGGGVLTCQCVVGGSGGGGRGGGGNNQGNGNMGGGKKEEPRMGDGKGDGKGKAQEGKRGGGGVVGGAEVQLVPLDERGVPMECVEFVTPTSQEDIRRARLEIAPLDVAGQAMECVEAGFSPEGTLLAGGGGGGAKQVGEELPKAAP